MQTFEEISKKIDLKIRAHNSSDMKGDWSSDLAETCIMDCPLDCYSGQEKRGDSFDV